MGMDMVIGMYECMTITEASLIGLFQQPRIDALLPNSLHLPITRKCTPFSMRQTILKPSSIRQRTIIIENSPFSLLLVLTVPSNVSNSVLSLILALTVFETVQEITCICPLFLFQYACIKVGM